MHCSGQSCILLGCAARNSNLESWLPYACRHKRSIKKGPLLIKTNWPSKNCLKIYKPRLKIARIQYICPFGQNLTKSAKVPAQKVYLACLWRLLNNSGPNRQRYILEAQRGKKYSKIGIKLLSVIYIFQFIIWRRLLFWQNCEPNSTQIIVGGHLLFLV